MINSEDGLWQLFGGDAPNAPGKNELTFAEFHDQTVRLDVSAKTRGDLLRPRFSVAAKDRFYRLRSSNVEAVVNQACLYATAGKIGDPDLRVAYLGIRDEPIAPGVRTKLAPRIKEPDFKKRNGKPASSAKNDSLDKIVTSYFATLTAESFEWRGKTYEPRDITVSPGIVRGFTCPAGCGGCCPRFSLDYIAPDNIPDGHPLTKRLVEFSGRKVEVWSDMQDDHDNPKCRNLNLENGRCVIHGFQPFSCDFELLRSMTFKDSDRSFFTQKLYGRGWAMMRVDGERGAMCEMTPADPDTVADVDRRLARLETWMQHFGLNPSRVGLIRDALPEIAASGKGFSITERELLMRHVGEEKYIPTESPIDEWQSSDDSMPQAVSSE